MNNLIVLTFLIFYSIYSSEIETSCGIAQINHPCLQELLNSPVMQRLKNIDQSGPYAHYGYCKFFSRYEHSLGVLALVQKANRDFAEQVAALLHDASHTVFSHLADTLYKTKDKSHSYQDSIHLKYLETQGVEFIINKFGLTINEINPDNPKFKALEQELPYLCADRIQYTIHTGLLFNEINPQEAQKIIHDLEFKNNTWLFKTLESAQRFAYLSLTFTKKFWDSPLNSAIYDCYTKILEHALQDKTISHSDIHYGTDDQIITMIHASKNPEIIKLLGYIKNIHSHFKVIEQEENPYNSINIQPKFRGTNPLILQDDQSIVSLFDIDPVFQKDFLETKEWCTKGYTIQIDW